MKKLKSNIEPARPSDSSLSSRATIGVPHGDGKNKSVWQSMVDNAGFAKRHPDIVLNKKRKKR